VSSCKIVMLQLSILKRAQCLILEIFLPLLCVAIVSNFFLGSSIVVDFLDKYRPLFWLTTLNTHVEKQILHISRDANSSHEKKVLIVGSSSVVNAIDENHMTDYFKLNGAGYSSKNYGLTGLLAYELPLLKKMLLTKDVCAVVYLYNHFSFGDELHPQATSTRWNTCEVVSSNLFKHTSPHTFAKAWMAETLFVVKYKNLLRTTFFNAAQGKLKVLETPYDFPRDWVPADSSTRRRLRTDTAPDDWIRRSYLDSAGKDNTLGMQGLQRFLKLANSNSIPVIVAPAPVPEFSRGHSYRDGIDEEKIDAKVARIADANNAVYIPRSDIFSIEDEDKFFMDDIHMAESGRKEYSLWLARRIRDILK